MAIGAAAVAASLTLLFTSQSVVIDAQNQRLALEQGGAGLEAVLAGEYFSQAGEAWQQESIEYKKEIILLADFAKKVNVSGAWQNGGLKKFAESFLVVTDQSQNLSFDTCALAFNKDWANPVVISSLALGEDNPATGLDANFKKVYLSANSATQLKEDLFIADIENLASPVLLASLNTGPGLNAVQVAGDYAYAANTSLNSQLQIIKITGPGAPAVMLNIKLPLGNDAVAKSIYYYGEKIFVGTEKSSGPELYVYNVQNPLAPVFLGAFETNTAVNGIYVYGNKAYLALAQDKLLTILNIENPGDISQLGFFSPQGSNVQSAQSLAILGDNVLLGRAGGLPHLGYKEFLWINAENSLAPTLNFEVDINASVRGLFLRDGLAFLAVNKPSEEFEIFSLSENLPKVSSLALPGSPAGLDCEGENMFFALEQQPQLQIISPNN